MLRSLRARLILSAILIVVVTLAAAAIALYARLGSYRDDVSGGTLRQVAAPIYYNLTLFNPNTGDGTAVQQGRRLRAELSSYLALQQRETGVIVLLLDANGNVIRESATDPDLADERFRVPEAPQRGIDFGTLPIQQHTTSDDEDYLFVTVPTTRLVRAQPSAVYGIVVALPEANRRDVVADLTPRLLFAGAAGLGAATMLLFLIWASLFRPLDKVTRGIRAVAAGDYSQRVPLEGPAEVRALSADVNRMADSVEASQRTLREFLANVSHELRTPLTSIRGFAQALQDGTLDSPEERARAARVIDAESRRVLHLVGELLDLSRIESGQQRMALEPVAVDELLAHIRDVFSIRAGEQGVTLDAPATGGLRVAADFDRIEQVLGNLVDNAFRHTPRGGRIEITAQPAGNLVEIAVSDDGAGIAPDEIPHVFDRFYRSALGEPEAPGAGLGLAISREIVRAHGGTIAATARPGGGTTIKFTIPAAAAPAAADAPRTAAGESALQPDAEA
jgi:signal transduction histidine kinase